MPSTATRYPPAGDHVASFSGLPAVCAERAGAPGVVAADPDLRRVDSLALALASALDGIALPLSRAAVAFRDREAWFEFGYARLSDYVRERHGRDRRWMTDLVALGRGVARVPELALALTGEDGGRRLGFCAAVTLSRVVTTETASWWIARARELTVAELRREAAGASPAGGPARAPDTADDGEADPESRFLVRYIVPVGVKAACEEALELYRTVVGHESTVTAFVEALVAEAMSGPSPPDLDSEADAMALRTVQRRASAEQALADATGHWSHLPERPEDAGAAMLAGDCMSRLAAIEQVAGRGGPAALDSQIGDLTSLENDLRIRLGELLAGMGELKAWKQLGFDSLGHYAEQRLGMSRTKAEDLSRASRKLRSLPVVRQAWREGRLGLEAALHIARMVDEAADRSIQQEWVERAARCTVKRMRDEVRAIVRASAMAVLADDGSPGPPDDRLAGSPGGSLDRPPRPLPDSAWQASLRREPGLARQRVRTLSRLTARHCRRTGIAGPDIHLCWRLPARLADDLMGAVESERARLSRLAGRVGWNREWPDPDAPGSLLAARAYICRLRRVPDWVGVLSLLEGFVEIWDGPGPVAKGPGREVLARDGCRCSAPGCTSRCRLERHHIVYQSRLGDAGACNVTTVCRFHHQRGEHGGLARVRGRAPLDLIWRLGKPELAEWFRNETRFEPPQPAP